MKKHLVFLIFLLPIAIMGQDITDLVAQKAIKIRKDTLKIDSASINPYQFRVAIKNKIIDSTAYEINYEDAFILFNKNIGDSAIITYHRYPDFLSKTYQDYSEKIVLEKRNVPIDLFGLNKKNKKEIVLFDGLNTNGSISRGVNVGNGQDASVNSSLDLQITGKLSEKVGIRASITDSSVPIQDNGYTQDINEFDRIFIELFSEQWKIRAGDINLRQDDYQFANFDKKVTGIGFDWKNKHWNTFVSGALVKGKFTSYSLTGLNGNQGPYKLEGANNESFILIVSGSENVYVNGRKLKRGNNEDYTINYNTAEITFTTTFPITSDMRIVVEFQYSDRNYTRFISHNGVGYTNDKITLETYIYHESDAKNQPLQQDLNDSQKEVLANAGNDTSMMFVSVAEETPYSEDRILYEKITINGTDTYVYSIDPNATLYNVNFTNLGENQGSYSIAETLATGKVYEYVGPNNGEYAPVVRLNAPNKLQMAGVKASYAWKENSSIASEFSFSNRDLNLFSSIDDEQNTGVSGTLDWKQTILSKKDWKFSSILGYQYIEETFNSVQRFNSIEFDRDWNIDGAIGNQSVLSTGLFFTNKTSTITYFFENLRLGSEYNGSKHQVIASIHTKRWKNEFKSSLLNTENSSENTTFSRASLQSEYNLDKKWLGVRMDYEDNERQNSTNNELLENSIRFRELEGYFGIGDSTAVHATIGYINRKNDSVLNANWQEVNAANTFYIQSKIIQNKNTNLNVYANYRNVKNANYDDTKSLNSRINFSKNLWNRSVQLSSLYETSSGSLAQQEFTYVEVDPGQGFYTWNDYNANGVQEIDEFEVAQFQDEANYLRVALTNVNYLPTDKVSFSQSFTLNPSSWKNKFWSRWFQQFFILTENQRTRAQDNFNLNPFNTEEENQIGLNLTVKNSLFLNKGKQRYSANYNYVYAENKTNLSIDAIIGKNVQHQLQFQHLLLGNWLLEPSISLSSIDNTSENYPSRNYMLENYSIFPKFSFNPSNQLKWSFFYEKKNKENQIGNLENLSVDRLGTSFKYNKKKNAIQLEYNYFKNTFIGDANSAIAYQMLEGLQDGKNSTWSAVFLQQINSFLSLNVNYSGRSSEGNQTIHTGTIQLRAAF